MPSYILEGSEEAQKYLQKGRARRAQRYRRRHRQTGENDIGQHESHYAAQRGDIETLIRITEEDNDALHATDGNGWMPIHEAARSGHMDIVDYLIKQGTDVNALTNVGDSPLDIAKNHLDGGHRVIDILQKLKEIKMGPEL